MSYSTQVLGAPVLRPSESVRSNGILSRIANAFVAAQQRRADRIVQPYLARLSNGELAALGFAPKEIAAIRDARHAPVVTSI
ncbi:MAG: hypothetical protein AB7E80_01450 [Hyphomicrobiaceae bacterium]